MMLRHSFGLEQEAAAVERAVIQAVAAGARSRDMKGTSFTEEIGKAVIKFL
jgi:3-isopropylmalate dehydrogenase